MLNKISFSAIAAMAALSMVSLTACSDENPDITNVPEESGLSSSSTPSVEPESSSSSGLELSSSSAPLIELSSSSEKSGDSVQVKLKCEYVTKGAVTRFLVEKSGEVLKDVCSEPSPIIGNGVYAEDCNAENEGRVLSLWAGNAKYGGMSYYRCQKDSWVKGDISLTCDTAGVAVGDTCRKTGMTGSFRASMPYPPSGYVFAYAGDGVWKRADQAQIDSLNAKQERLDAAIKEQCGEPELGKSNQCCFTPPAEIAKELSWEGSALYEYERDSHEWFPRAYFSSSDCGGQVKEIIED